MKWEQLLCGERIRPNKRRASSSDLRTEFEKDYHRIIGSASFRRLQDKTQVFPLDRSDFIRTRLTHSLEVSSFGKSLGQNIAERIMQEEKEVDFSLKSKAAICDLLQCAGLIHDIGNPPFGHFGETVIRDYFKKNLPQLSYQDKKLNQVLTKQMQRDFYYFEGNTQALRVVSKLHFLVDEHGMNLTKALLGTIIKYPVSSMDINKESDNIKCKKMGFYYADKAIFEDIQKSCGTDGARHPLAYVLEAADDIAYKTADIEDAVKKGCISYRELLEELRDKQDDDDSEYNKLVNVLEMKYDTAKKKRSDRQGQYAIQNWLVSVQGKLIASATQAFMDHYGEIMSGDYTKDLFFDTPMDKMMEVLGDVAYRYAFISTPILKLEVAAETIMNFLLDKFIDAAIYFDTDEEQTEVQKKLMSLISENYKEIYFVYSKEKPDEEKLYLRLLLVTDFVCGMTDSYAKSLYQELKGIS